MTIVETKIELPTSLGIPRIEMPQVDREDVRPFIEYLDREGIKYTGVKVSVKKLKSTQKEINKEKVQTLISNPEDVHLKPVIFSSDYYILDGHHRVIAQLNIDRDSRVKGLKIDQPIRQLIQTVKKFPNVKYKSVE